MCCPCQEGQVPFSACVHHYSVHTYLSQQFCTLSFYKLSITPVNVLLPPTHLNQPVMTLEHLSLDAKPQHAITRPSCTVTGQVGIKIIKNELFTWNMDKMMVPFYPSQDLGDPIRLPIRALIPKLLSS